MMVTRPPNVDIIQEIRLRRWARENYVPAALRGPKWHPVVLDEMRGRDAELEALATGSTGSTGAAGSADGARFVPLAPATVYVLHEPHRDLAGPHAPADVRVQADQSWFYG